jgi:hypothetical protein
MMNKRERKQNWMRAYSDELQSQLPAVAGRIDWDTATYFHNEGRDAVEAAQQHAESLREQWSKAPRNTSF